MSSAGGASATGAARLADRSALAAAGRVVVKVGSSSLTTPSGGIDDARLIALVNALAERIQSGTQVVLVSSGAIAAGLGPLGLARRPRDLATQQAAASVGQGLLVARYTSAAAAHGLTVGQVLLTADDVIRRTQYRNAQRALERLLGMGVLPVVNENDTVATAEIRFGDNDRLAALVAHLVHADALVLLSDVDALYDGPPSRPGSRRVPVVTSAADLDDVVIGGSSSAVGTGGMTTKLQAASIATGAGIATVLASAAQAGEALRGDDVGTWFSPTGARPRTRMLWLAHAANPLGRLVLDAGAVAAVVKRGASLLPAGVVAAEGTFEAGDPVDLCDETGHAVARGLVNYSSAEVPELLGRSTRERLDALGPGYDRVLVHRDDLVLLPRRRPAGPVAPSASSSREHAVMP
ncbi:glutamate 5-kinase [Quadrisphaera granulorum]|uniref:Glutamate 5-kinase n=1 Tax=Quadrisphaera granulorum TaxID=317664 RepID=A0A316A8L1_9ACTN|nr:glutamate 5-kinase [Quadrisphaera granulorum]PWJ53973.1 glutamate 5-kinase [Quadrisphaera granulorum]SZE96430.1 glutamate 5-kinase [Quadrisphaera granulorum]